MKNPSHISTLRVMGRPLLLLLVFLLNTPAWADDITLEQAFQIASQFSESPQTQQLAKRRGMAQKAKPTLAYAMRSRVADKDNVYVINLGNDQGFVIVAGETGADGEVLGYCDHGSFAYDTAPIQLQSLLDNYSAGIDSLRRNPSLAKKPQLKGKVVDIGSVIVGPLLTTTWNQWGPYNMYCPEGCPAGCYPVALAQLMNYWKWPKQSQGYLNTIGEFHGEDFSGHVYDWDNMIDNYSIDYLERKQYTAEQANAVAYLMADIGKAFNTVYSPEGSGTPFSVDALVSNFGYEADYYFREADEAKKLTGYMKSDLDDLRPVLYSGKSGGVYHAMVCDGYTSNDFFHFNYGWGGEADGYYKNASVGYYNDASIYQCIRPYDAQRKVIDGIEYGLMPDGTADVWNYTLGSFGMNNGTVHIPSFVTYNGKDYAVTRIRQMAFYRKGNFDKLVVGDNLKMVDPASFFYTHIDTLVLGDKMEVVPDDAFGYTYIKHLTIGKNIKRIGKRAFYYCTLSTVDCKSPAFEVDEEAFAITSPWNGEWFGHITKLGRKAFYAAKINLTDFKKNQFTNLEVIGDSALMLGSFGGTPKAWFTPKLREIAPSAFDGWPNNSFIEMGEDNPYFTVHGHPITSNVYNKNMTSAIALIGNPNNNFPETVVRLEPRCFRPKCTLNRIPRTVVEMVDAFKDFPGFEDDLYCMPVTPPLLTDESFSEAMLKDMKYTTLHVPHGTEELYRKAPGWRLFTDIVGDQEFNPVPAQGREYQLVIHRSGEEQTKICIPLSKIKDMRVDETDGNKDLVIKRTGKDDVVADIATIDSITYRPGFIFGNAEIFDLNDSTLSAKAQKCDVKFDPTVIDEDVQLCVRYAALTPKVTDKTLRGFALDLSLSNDIHQLSGTVDITVPMETEEGEKMHAAYYNEDTGEWEPVFFRYDEDNGKVVITSDHLSTFSIFTTPSDVEFTRDAIMELYYEVCPELYSLNEAMKILLDIVSSDDPDKQMINEFKDEMSFWQSVGLDGFYNLVVSVTDPLLNFKPEAIDNAVTYMGYLGTAISIVNVAGADIKGDDIGVASGTLSTILNYSTGQMAAAIGTPIMSAAMGCVAFIGIVLNKFGTLVQDYKFDFIRRAYRYYYSMQGYHDLFNWTKFFDGNPNLDLESEKFPHRQYRTCKDWYDYFYPAFAEGKMNEEEIDKFIKQSVRRYCDRFWEESGVCQEMAYEQVETKWNIRPSFPTDLESERKKISEEYYADLMTGELVSVITAIKRNIMVQANKRYIKAAKDVSNMMNTKIGLRFIDSGWKEGEKSKYAGWKVAFTEIPSTLKDQELWKKTINERGHAGIGYFTEYSLVQNRMKTQITLYNEEDVEQKTYEFQIPENTGKIILDFDIEKGGKEIEAPRLNGLQLTYDPDYLQGTAYLSGKNDKERGDSPDEYPVIFMPDGQFFRNVRMQKEIEKFFKKHDFINVDKAGNIQIGDDIVGKFDGDKGTGKFTINTTNPFTETTLDKWLKEINDATNTGGIQNMVILHGIFNGTIKHKIDCEFTLTRTGEEGEYLVSYTGTGTYQVDANVVEEVVNLTRGEMMGVFIPGDPISADDVTISPWSGEGKVTLNYSTKIK